MSESRIPQEFIVRVECMTFNHAPYIEDAMNGFCMQRTNFPFVCVIVDDASTDGEPEVIRNYLKKNFDLYNSSYTRTEDTDDYVLTFARHKTNHNCFFGILFLKYNHWGKKSKYSYYESWTKAKYISSCEGDDYWIDPLKLQMQVDLLEERKDFGMCYTACKHYNQSEGKIKEGVFSNKGLCSFKDLLINEPATTLTVLYRTELGIKYLNEIKPNTRKWLMGDTPLLLWFAANSKIYNMPEVTAIYRELSESASHTKNIRKNMDFHKSTRDIRLFFCKLYPSYGKALKKEVWKAYYQSCLIDAFEKQAVNYIMKYLLLSHCTNRTLYMRLANLIKYKIKKHLYSFLAT